MIAKRYTRMLVIIFIAMMGFSSAGIANNAAKAKKSLDKKVQNLLSKMTLQEKIGQMTQVTIQVVSSQRGDANNQQKTDLKALRKAIKEYHVGSLLNVYDKALTLAEWHRLITQIQDVATKETRLGIPVIYGIDAIHGANYTAEATIFPQSLAMAATWNRDLVRKSAEITAYEVRASGIPWNFNPVLGVGRHPLWPRLFETFGEDTYTVSELGTAYIQGMQGDDYYNVPSERVAACMKHYLGYSYPLSGKDRTPAWIPERMLRDVFLPPFKAAVEAGVHTVMINSGEINGIPVHSSYYLLTEILRDEMGFEGLVVSDWEDINRLHSRDQVAGSRKDAVRMAVMAGVDMSMVPYTFDFATDLYELVQEGLVPESRIDQAVSRILAVKFKLGLFENPYPEHDLQKAVGSAASSEVSLKAAQEALTLLKNTEKALPLSKNTRVLVTGPTANQLSVLNSGWTYTWQGNQENLYPKDKLTILKAIQQKIGADNVNYVEGSSFDTALNVAEAVSAAADADAIVVCIGEAPYCETPGNIHDLTLQQAQLDLVAAMQETGKPVILVLVEGRPRVITPVVEKSAAILMAYLPGNEGGRAIADVLFGDVNPSGKLPITYPQFPNDLVCYDYKPLETDDPNKMAPLYPFGHGLSYTTFSYSNLAVDRPEITDDQTLTVSVDVTNSGDLAGKENVHLFLRDVIRSISPPVRQLKRFSNVYLEPGEKTQLTFSLNKNDFTFHGRNNREIFEPGMFEIMIGDQKVSFRLKQSEISRIQNEGTKRQ